MPTYSQLLLRYWDRLNLRRGKKRRGRLLMRPVAAHTHKLSMDQYELLTFDLTLLFGMLV